MSKTLDTEAPDVWTKVGSFTWGKYLASIERAAILRGLELVHDNATTAIDIGAESGRWTQLMLQNGLAVTSTEVGAEKLASCQQKNPEANCILVSPDDCRLPVDDNSMDVAVSIEVEINEHDWFVPELQRVLRHGGAAVFTLNNQSSYRGQLSNIKSKLSGDEIFYTRSYRHMCKQLKECNFEIVETEGFGWFPFGRFSNSPLVPIATTLEGWSQLRRLARWSPWVVYICQLKSGS